MDLVFSYVDAASNFEAAIALVKKLQIPMHEWVDTKHNLAHCYRRLGYFVFPYYAFSCKVCCHIQKGYVHRM